ncbi:MAG: hypothetical protein AAGG81_00650 [Chlamydiota bacterium]
MSISLALEKFDDMLEQVNNVYQHEEWSARLAQQGYSTPHLALYDIYVQVGNIQLRESEERFYANSIDEGSCVWFFPFRVMGFARGRALNLHLGYTIKGANKQGDPAHSGK